MLQFEELRLKLQGMEPELRELKQSLNIDKLGIEIAELERKAAEPSFWDDMENSQKVLQRTAQLKASVETYNKLQSLYEDTLTLIELAEEAGDESVYEEAAADTEQLQTRMAEVRLTTLLTGEYDSKNAILTFHAGAGRQGRLPQHCPYPTPRCPWMHPHGRRWHLPPHRPAWHRRCSRTGSAPLPGGLRHGFFWRTMPS